jgi:hypothetical protein
MSQFFYKRTVEGKVYTDSFNTDKVIRTVELEDGKRVVILDDFHERVDEVPDINIKTNKMMGVKRQRNTYQSEITLEVEDAERFKSLFA